MKTIKTETIQWLLGKYSAVEFRSSFLMNISAETFDKLKQVLTEDLDAFDLTDDDIKSAWKYWFEDVTFGGGIVCQDLKIKNSDKPYHDGITDVHDYLVLMVNTLIDSF